MTEQQTHLTQLIEQQQQLISDVNILSNQLTSKRELLIKVQCSIEYLEQTGTTLPEPEKKEEETEESLEKQ